MDETVRDPTGDGHDALARCVGDVERFEVEHWGRAPLVRHADGGFDDLLDIDVVEQLLLTKARRPSFRVVRDGANLPADQTTSAIRLGGTTVDDAADIDRIAVLLEGGATLVLQGLHHTWLPVASFCTDLRAATCHPIQANAYLSPPGAAGLRRHADTHDVIVLQLSGTKRWEVAGVGPVTLEPADVMYLPAGTEHEAACHDDHSLHLTIGILRVTYRHVVRRILDGIGGDLDRPLPLGYAREPASPQLVNELSEALEAVAKELQAIDVAAAATSERERAIQRRRPAQRLRAALGARRMGDEVRIGRVPELRATACDGNGEILLVLGDRRLRLPSSTGAAVDALMRVDEIRVGDLAGLDQAGRAVLARRLLGERFVRVRA